MAASRRPLLGVAFVIAILVFGACGGAASPTTTTTGAASQAAASQAAPTAASAAAAPSNAPLSGNSNAACAVITGTEAATVLGKPIREIRPVQVQVGVGCYFIVDPLPPLPPHTAGTAYPYNFIQVDLGPSANSLAPEFKSSSSGLSQAWVVGVKGDKSVRLMWSDSRRNGDFPNAVAVPITDATFAALKALLVTALAKI
jgi:hypothetical protein